MSNQGNVSLAWNKYEWAFLMAIVILGLAMRLYGINMPLIESHQVRQAQTAMMARNLYEDNMNIFRTRLDFLGNVPGYLLLEFPLMHAITALLYYLFGVHDIIGRLVSVAFSVGAMFLIYRLARQFLARSGAFAALILYAFSPMNIFFSRAFMPESSMMFFIVGAVYYFLKWLDKKSAILYLTAIVFAAFAGLAKPTAGLIFVPIITAWFLKEGKRIFSRFDFWFYILFAMVPLFFWVAYANYFNARLPYFAFSLSDNWLKIIMTRGIVMYWFDPKFYAFMVGSIGLLLLTPLGFIGSVAGVFLAAKAKKTRILYAWLVAVIVYFYALAGCNRGHIYYHLPLLPVAVIFFGFSIEWLLSKHELI